MHYDLTRLFPAADLRALGIIPLHIVLGTRLTVIWTNADKDPLPDLAQRFRSVEAARAIMALVSHIDTAWPEHFMVSRPCCAGMTPDEVLLASVTSEILAHHHDAARNTMRGFVPAHRHDALIRQIAHAAGTISAAVSLIAHDDKAV